MKRKASLARNQYGGGLVTKSCPTLATQWTVARQAPQSMEFSRQGYWSGLPFLSPGIFPTQGSNPGLPHCRQTVYRLSHQGSEIGLSKCNHFQHCFSEPIKMLTLLHCYLFIPLSIIQDFPGGSVVTSLPANAGDAGSILGLGRSPGEGYDNPL